MAILILYCIPPTETEAFNARRYTNIPVKDMFCTCSFPVLYMFIYCSIPVLYMFIYCSIPVHHMFLTCSLPVYFVFISLGMHIAALDSGGHRATLDCLARELLDLWENPMEAKDGKRYVVAAMGFNFDTKAYEKIKELFPQTGDQVMYAHACVVERFLPRPNALSKMIQSRQFFIRCVTKLLHRYCWLDGLQ